MGCLLQGHDPFYYNRYAAGVEEPVILKVYTGLLYLSIDLLAVLGEELSVVSKAEAVNIVL